MAEGTFDPALMDVTRFGIVSLLAATHWAEFPFVRDSMGLSDSALSKQTSYLSKAGYVEVHKGYVGKRPRTWLRLSPQGRTALTGHIEYLQGVARAVQEQGASHQPDELPDGAA
ncbi:winged helix-turn-helix domain-containing protein [Kineosporia babensis]|uniref:Transcriptional regulator n=1 Tax=Kineosporia babensis TaxID=499548 RepID=A0A9X1NA04_9ACTN|nr:transcriptional regulator [Kineosporia babensis]MCD5311327.1 transcriptional regulator [Kineosporia babensis]